MSQNQTTDFFDNLGGAGAPTAKLKDMNDWVSGTIVDMFKRPYIPFGHKEAEKRADGTDKEQLVIVLQTANRGWQGLSEVPMVDKNDPSKGYRDPSEDDGKRAVYVPEGKNIQFAISRAVQAAGSPFQVGGTLAIKIFNLKPTDKGNPLKEHEARYTAPSAADAFIAQAPSAPPAPPAPPVAPAAPQAPTAPAPAPAPPVAQDPWAAAPAAPQAPAAPAAPAPAQQDPWAAQGAPAPSAPPF